MAVLPSPASPLTAPARWPEAVQPLEAAAHRVQIAPPPVPALMASKRAPVFSLLPQKPVSASSTTRDPTRLAHPVKSAGFAGPSNGHLSSTVQRGAGAAAKRPDRVAPMNLAQGSASVFNGGATFAGMQPAYRAAFEEIYARMQADGGRREYGFEIVPGTQGKVALGRLVVGDEDSVASSLSDEVWFLRALSQSLTDMPRGHSHPQVAADTEDHRPTFSAADLANLPTTRVLGGVFSGGLLDYTEAVAFQITLDARVEMPRQVRRGLVAAGDVADSMAAQDWLRQQLEAGKLRVYDLGSVGGEAHGARPTQFGFQVGFPDRPTQTFLVEPIRVD